MRRQISITVVGIALGAVACGSGESSSPGTESSSASGGANNQVSGSGGGLTTGGTTSNTGGGTTSKASSTGGSPTGGATNNVNVGGNATGGTTNSPSVGGNATGGTPSNPGGSTGGNGVGGKGTGGATSNPATGGKGTGGATSNPATGGKSTGGATANPGGSAGTGGANPSGGGTSTSTLITSASGAYWKTGTWTEVTSTATVTINDASTAQTWDGFGGAFNEKGWSYLTTQTMKDQAIQALFGNDGCRFAWGRIPIGASDYALSRYSDDEVSSGTDLTMASFSITRDLQNLIPYIKAAQAVKSNIRFWASPWSPPTWMKTGPYSPGDGPSNSNFDGGVMKSDDATLKAHAQYLVKWIQAFAAQNIKVEIVAPQNEPNYQQNYPSCHWDTSVFVKYVGSYLGPALSSAGLSTKVMDGTLSNTNGDSAIGSQVLQDATAKSYIGAIGVQWGMAAANQVSTLKGLAGNIPIWVSEHQCGGTMGSTAPAPNDQAYGVASWGYIRDAIKNGLTAYNAWNMVLDPGGLGIDDTRKWPQNALIVANSGSLTMTPAYYVFRHVSQFVDVGAKVISSSGGDAVAFKNPDGSLVAIMYNSGSANNSYVVAIGGKKVQFAMPGNGWATVKVVP